jgi:hypothetical protein
MKSARDCFRREERACAPSEERSAQREKLLSPDKRASRMPWKEPRPGIAV